MRRTRACWDSRGLGSLAGWHAGWQDSTPPADVTVHVKSGDTVPAGATSMERTHLSVASAPWSQQFPGMPSSWSSSRVSGVPTTLGRNLLAINRFSMLWVTWFGHMTLWPCPWSTAVVSHWALQLTARKALLEWPWCELDLNIWCSSDW